jgi:hypothetical protein
MMPPVDVSPVANPARLSAAPPSSFFLALELYLSVQTSQSQALGSWHWFAAIYRAAACVSWLRHPRKNRSRSSATPARLSLLGGQLRMLMRRGNVSIVAMTHSALVPQSLSERLAQCISPTDRAWWNAQPTGLVHAQRVGAPLAHASHVTPGPSGKLPPLAPATRMHAT